jgi:ketosteroid isomerase-like protein
VDGSDNKKLVLEWLATAPEVARSMLGDGFVWHTARSTAELLNDGDPDFRGQDAQIRLQAIGRAAYSGDTKFDMAFCIAEGEWVVMMATIAAAAHDGEPYANNYVFIVRCRDGKIAEVWEYADTKLWWETIVGRPGKDKTAALKRRLAEEAQRASG